MLLLLKIIKPFKKVIGVRVNNCHGRLFRSSSINLWLHKRLNANIPSVEREKYYRTKDNIPEQFQLIYRAPVETYINYVMYISTITAGFISLAALYQFTTDQTISTPMIETKLIMNADDIYYFSIAFILLNVILRYVVAMCPIRIYKNLNCYRNVYTPQIPGLRSQHTYNRGDVKKIDFYMNPWNNATYKMGQRNCIIFEDYFKTPSEFNDLLDIGTKK